MPMSTLKEYVKLLGMTVVFLAGQMIGFGIVVPLWGAYNYITDKGVIEND